MSKRLEMIKMKHIELITGNSLAGCRKFLIIFIIGKLVLAFDFHALDIFFLSLFFFFNGVIGYQHVLNLELDSGSTD
jgi:hypothetical protein